MQGNQQLVQGLEDSDYDSSLGSDVEEDGEGEEEEEQEMDEAAVKEMIADLEKQGKGDLCSSEL